jgi:hypothetical protein
MYQERVYRNKIKNNEDLIAFNVTELESDMLILADANLETIAKEAVRKVRLEITKYINQRPEFLHSLKPIKYDQSAARIIREMIEYSSIFNVGPMATVAGAVSQYVGNALLKHSKEVIIENGGDLFVNTHKERVLSIFTEDIVLKDKLKIIVGQESQIGICTSSGKLGHSKSFGNSDAVVVKAKNSIVADAAATAFANQVKNNGDIKKVLLSAKKNEFVEGVVIVIDGKLGVWGNIRFMEEKRNAY